MKFDWTINFPVVFTTIAVIIGGFRVWLQQRDFNRNLEAILGKRTPRDERHGLLGDVADLKECRDIHQELIDSHHLKLGLDRRKHVRVGTSDDRE